MLSETLTPIEVTARKQCSRINIATFPEFVKKLIVLHRGRCYSLFSRFGSGATGLLNLLRTPRKVHMQGQGARPSDARTSWPTGDERAIDRTFETYYLTRSELLCSAMKSRSVILILNLRGSSTDPVPVQVKKGSTCWGHRRNRACRDELDHSRYRCRPHGVC